MVLLLLDWENIVFSLIGLGPSRMNLSRRIEKLMEWVSQIGNTLGGYGFVFTPSHFSSYHRDICDKYKLRPILCPKRKTRKDNEEDTVDETIIWFGKIMINHPDIKFICLVSGDEDFAPLLQKAKEKGIKIALVVPTLNCISTNKVMINFIDVHPKTGKKMALRLDQV